MCFCLTTESSGAGGGGGKRFGFIQCGKLLGGGCPRVIVIFELRTLCDAGGVRLSAHVGAVLVMPLSLIGSNCGVLPRPAVRRV